MLDGSELTKEMVQEMSGEEVVMWATELQQQEQIDKMRKALLKYVEMRDAERDAHTIKIPCKVVGESAMNQTTTGTQSGPFGKGKS